MNKNLRLSANTFVKLMDVFKQNQWEIQSETDGMESRFNRFCELLSQLELREQNLVIDLTKRFTVINDNDYLSYIVKLLDKLYKEKNQIFANTNKFFVFPLIAPEDVNKMKSSRFVWYFFRNEKIKFSPMFAGKKLIHCDTNQSSWIKDLKPDETVILLDDFLGSGETAVNAINWLVENCGVSADRLVILVIAAQEEGISHVLQETGVKTYTYFCFKKGISDYYVGEQLVQYTEIMTGIEKKLKVDSSYSFGYNASEALISLIRTPNNTFPVFWKPVSKKVPAPFQRD